MKVFFSTKNKGKFMEAKEILKGFDIDVEQAPLDLLEIQGTLEEVAMFKVMQAFHYLKKPVFVEDTGFFINSLNGFPGPYAKHFIENLGKEKISALFSGEEAYYKTIIAFTDGKRVETFSGILKGRISEVVEDGEGFAYDFIFIPEGEDKTLSSLGLKFKNEHSSRRKALEKLAKALKERFS